MLSIRREESALEETACLLRSPANAEWLIRSIAGLHAGKAEPRPLFEED